MTTIKPRTLQGFRDFLPAAMIPRERLMDTARRVYRSYGFCPIDTPALEYLEILQGKGSAETDRQIYRFEDHGGRSVGMRFDLTVPLARYAAQHINELGIPFKRYHIATVWRGERPQKGRYREFMQCDFDTIGTKSIAADIETVLVVNDLLEAIGIEQFTISANNRKVLNGLLEKFDLANQSTAVLRALDKLTKVGLEGVKQELTSAAELSPAQAAEVLRLAAIDGSHDQVLTQLDDLLAGNAMGEQGVQELRDVCAGVAAAGLRADRLKLDVSIARGLDYYTGTVIETTLDALPTIGSVCSGGRYDNLAEQYTKQQLPGIGASLGLDRLLAAMEELNLIEPSRTTADVLVAFFDQSRLHDYLSLTAQLRAAGLAVELYPEPKKLGQQLKYASDRGFRAAIIAGDDEFAAGTCQVKDLAARTSQEVKVAADCTELVNVVRKILS
jgi:histidyl-tRNA synthetase